MKRNAFETLMSSPQRKKSLLIPPPPPTTSHSDRRDGLLEYTINPERYPRSIVVDYDDEFVLIRDAYPKSRLHLLLIPRKMEVNQLHPFTALSSPTFLASVTRKVSSLIPLLESECTRLFGRYDDGWSSVLKVGVHAIPSMNHLHVHLLTPDLSSLCLKTKHHYNSFTTPFFVDLARFPLDKDDELSVEAREDHVRGVMKCWKCHAELKNIPTVKKHIEQCWLDWLNEHKVAKT